ncbi:MAG: Rieske 2Fe-2S domain-containing protein [Phycisphaerales bacterium]
MRITRRQFSAALGTTIALTVLGCSDEPEEAKVESGGRSRNKLTLPDAPFSIGAPHKYHSAGVYEEYRESKGIYLVSDGKQLVALSAVCTHNGCGTRFDSMSRIFKCPCHQSTFTSDGLNISGGKAKRPLERCMISLDGKPGDASAQLSVDPTKRYRQEIDNPVSGRNWSSPNSVYVF